MICPPEVGYWVRLAQLESESAAWTLGERAWLLRMLRYHTVAASLRDVDSGHGTAAIVGLAQELVALAASVGDPLGIEQFFSAYLEMMKRAGLNENSSELRESVRALIEMATSEGMTGRWLILLVAQRERLDECARVEASWKMIEAALAEIEPRLAKHDQMTLAEQKALQADIEEIDRRIRWEERSRRNSAGVNAPERTAFRCWRRPARRAARRGTRRCTSRRATCDAGGAAGGDGDGPGGAEGPRPRRSLLRAYGVAPVRSPGGRGVKPRPHARGSEPPALGVGVACGRGPYPSAARDFSPAVAAPYLDMSRGALRKVIQQAVKASGGRSDVRVNGVRVFKRRRVWRGRVRLVGCQTACSRVGVPPKFWLASSVTCPQPSEAAAFGQRRDRARRFWRTVTVEVGDRQ